MSQRLKIQSHLTDAEIKKLDKKANKALVSRSTFIRQTLVESLELHS